MEDKLKIIKLIFKYCKFEAIALFIVTFLESILPILKTYAFAYFIDSLAVLKEFRFFIIPIFIVCFLKLLQYILGFFNKFFKIQIKNNLMVEINEYIINKIAKLEYEYIENPEKQNLISLIIRKPDVEISEGYYNMLNITSIMFNIIGVMYIIYSQSWLVSIVLFFLSIPLSFFSIKKGKGLYKIVDKMSVYNRKCNYLSGLLFKKNYANERTLFDFTNEIQERFDKEYGVMSKNIFSTQKSWIRKSLIYNYIYISIFFIIIAFFIQCVKNRLITCGMFVSLFNSLIALNKRLLTELSMCVNNISMNCEFIKSFNKFENLKSHEEFIDKPSEEQLEFECIEFKNVSFSYTGNDKVIDNISFKLEKNKRYALVGKNGCGKTTLVKLMIGLYDNYTGKIFINGKDIKEYKYSQLKSMYTVVFQDFAKYYTNLYDNVKIGDINGKDDKKIIDIIKYVFNYDESIEFENNLKTVLGNILPNGRELSYGQWQKISLARCYMSEGSFKILDEPTSALDPLIESKVYMEFNKILNNKSSLFISHRMGLIKFVDEILVIDNGKLVEQGTADALIKKRGIFYKMFEAQRKWYK